MTREEAIKVIKDMIDNWQEDYAEEVIMAAVEIKALNMAIKALEQEPCEDCISRQQAIDKMQELEEYRSLWLVNSRRL